MDKTKAFNLLAGYPSLCFTKRSTKVLANAAESLVTSDDGISGKCLLYGAHQGSVAYRNELAKFLTYNYQEKEPISSDDLQITAGATHGLHFTVSAYFQTGDIVFVEDPTYFFAISMLRDDLGMKVIPVKMDEKGMDVDLLEKLILEMKPSAKSGTAQRPFWAMIYTIPTFQNPTGRVLPEERCHRLVDIARKHGLLVFCDDAYNLLHYNEDGLSPRRLLSYETERYGKKEGYVISNGTFSKIMGPGVRLGWIESSENIIDRLRTSSIASGGGSFNHYTSQLVAIAMRDGLQQKLLDDMKVAHTVRVKAVNDVLKEHLPPGITYQEPQGGYFYWFKLPDKMDADMLLKRTLEKYNLKFLVGYRCSAQENFKNFIRVSLSHYEEKELVESFFLLCQAIKECM